MDSRLQRLGGFSAILGGVARIVATFIPPHPASQALEALYDSIDVLLLLGLIALYARWHRALGWLGLVLFTFAVAAFSFIGGPDADPFGFSTYRVGASVLGASLGSLSLIALVRRAMPLAGPLFWIGSLAMGIIAGLLPQWGWAFAAAGVFFGAAFVAVGIELIRGRKT